MCQGFIIQLASASFPGASCFVYRLTTSGVPAVWGRITERAEAHVFKSRESALACISTMLDEIRYQAPELNGSLGSRLAAAQIVPA